MSDLLYMTRLRWSGYSGIAKLHGRTVMLRLPPDLGTGELVGVDYVPEIHLCEVQPLGHGRRDMTADEIRAADRVLAQMCGGILHN